MSEIGGYNLLLIMVQTTRLLSFTELFQSMHFQILSSEYRRNVANDTVGAKSALGIRNLIYEGVNLETREIGLNKFVI
jgi:hypothetical protein